MLALLKVDDTPRRVALAFGVGLFLAFFPVLGIHTAMALGIGFAFRLSRVALLVGVYVNNPWTIVPMLTGGTLVGCWLLGVPSKTLLEAGFHVDDGFPRSLATTLRPLLWPYVVGNLVAGAASGYVGYAVLKRVLERRQEATSASAPPAMEDGPAPG